MAAAQRGRIESGDMLTNRSVPVETVLPHVVYRNLAEAIVWLERAFGFRENYRYGAGPSGAQMFVEKAVPRRRPHAANGGLISSGELTPVLKGVDLSRILLEITEHAIVVDYESLTAALQPLRGPGTEAGD